MGMTDKQFNAFLRFVLDKSEEIKKQALNENVSDDFLKQIDKLIELLTESMKD